VWSWGGMWEKLVEGLWFWYNSTGDTHFLFSICENSLVFQLFFTCCNNLKFELLVLEPFRTVIWDLVFICLKKHQRVAFVYDQMNKILLRLPVYLVLILSA
jgi:uncharacterized protein (UPF0262 family)